MPKCPRCLFFDICPGRIPCEDYAPTDEEEEIEKYIEELRESFYEDWLEYLGEDEAVAPESIRYSYYILEP